MKLTTRTFAFMCALSLSNVSFASTEDAIASAEKARQAAAEVGYEWRDTAAMIKKAKELAAKGKSEEAITLAKKAEQQSKSALSQYHFELKRYASSH